MEIKKIKENQNPLFKRKEIVLEVVKNTTPSYAEVEEIICKNYSTTPEKIKIKRIKSMFGQKKFIVEANVYESKEHKEEIEPKQKPKKEK